MKTDRKIYFAGSIRGGRDDQALYLDIIEKLTRYGTVLTEHVGSSSLTNEGETLSDRQVHDRDVEWLKNAETLVAEVTTPSLGVGYEIAKATEWGKPVLCLFRTLHGRPLSAMIAGSKDVVLRGYLTVTDLDDILKEFFLKS
jgi:hypothetical protein